MAAPAIKGTPTLVAGTSATMPTHAIGDLLVIVAFNGISTTAPTKPAASGTVPAYVDIDTGVGANTESIHSAYFVATATNHTTGTWTTATHMFAIVVSGARATLPIGGHARGGGSTANQAVAPAITLTYAGGSSLILVAHGGRGVSAWGSPPSGYTDSGTPVTGASGAICLSQKTSSTTDGAVTRTDTTSTSGSYGTQIEILNIQVAGTAAGTVTFTGASTGSATHHHYTSVAPGTVSFTGAAAGTVTNHLISGTAAGTVAFTGAAVGTAHNHQVNGTAAGTVTFTGASTGAATHHHYVGTAAGTVTFTGAAVGTVIRHQFSGTAAGTVSFTGAAVGTAHNHQVSGTAAGTVSFTGAATGVATHHHYVGTAAGTVTFTGAAAGTIGNHQYSGTAAGTVVFTGAAVGSSPHTTVNGTAAGIVTFTGLAKGSGPRLVRINDGDYDFHFIRPRF